MTTAIYISPAPLAVTPGDASVLVRQRQIARYAVGVFLVRPMNDSPAARVKTIVFAEGDVTIQPKRLNLLISGTVKNLGGVPLVRQVTLRRSYEFAAAAKQVTVSAPDGSFSFTTDGCVTDKWLVQAKGAEDENLQAFDHVTGVVV